MSRTTHRQDSLMADQEVGQTRRPAGGPAGGRYGRHPPAVGPAGGSAGSPAGVGMAGSGQHDVQREVEHDPATTVGNPARRGGQLAVRSTLATPAPLSPRSRGDGAQSRAGDERAGVSLHRRHNQPCKRLRGPCGCVPRRPSSAASHPSSLQTVESGQEYDQLNPGDGIPADESTSSSVAGRLAWKRGRTSRSRRRVTADPARTH